MITNPKVGDKVWVMVLNRATQKRVMQVREFGGRVFLYFNLTDNQSSDYCFPSLEALLQHLKDTAIYYKGE